MAFTVAQAAQTGIQKLYHYQTFIPEYLVDTLANQRVHFSKPKNFNDPWDCNPYFDIARVTDPVYRASCVEVLQRSPIPGLTAAKQRGYQAMMQSDRRFLKDLIETTTESYRRTIVERWRIYCLTPHSDATLMWSHYSNKHQGICLEFDAGQTVFGNACQVQYRDTLPALDILTPTGESAFRLLVTKSIDWRYEDEYRILARDREADDAPSQFLPITEREFLLLPPGALTAVIAGCRANVEEIKALVEEHAPGLPVKRAVQAPDRYCRSIQD